MTARGMSIQERIMTHVSVEDQSGCWLWVGAKNSNGYGSVKVGGRMVGAHRALYEAINGVVSSDLQIDHLCRVKHCVNPQHMEPVSPRTNTLRGNATSAINSKKTHCIRGHELTLENTYKSKREKRHCKLCDKSRHRGPKHDSLREN